jgi:hypothetical protein
LTLSHERVAKQPDRRCAHMYTNMRAREVVYSLCPEVSVIDETFYRRMESTSYKQRSWDG